MQGYIYPNEFELHWSLLIVLYPYLTGLVAGAFILASLERVFNVKEVQPTYRLALLTALAFLLVAPLPLLAHLGHPERSYEIFLTPQLGSAMAVFGRSSRYLLRIKSRCCSESDSRHLFISVTTSVASMIAKRSSSSSVTLSGLGSLSGLFLRR